MKNHSKGQWVKGISAAGCYDSEGRKYFKGKLYGEERDENGRRKVIVEGVALEEDWQLIESAPELLEVCKFLVEYSGVRRVAGSDPRLEYVLSTLAKAEGRRDDE